MPCHRPRGTHYCCRRWGLARASRGGLRGGAVRGGSAAGRQAGCPADRHTRGRRPATWARCVGHRERGLWGVWLGGAAGGAW